MFLLTVAGVTTALGAWVTTGSSDITDTVWFKAAVGVAIVAVVLTVVGGIGAFLTRPADVTDTHAETLKRSLDTVKNCIERGVLCEYGDEEGSTLGRDSFPRHFKGLKLKKRWEPLVRAYEQAVLVLQARIDREAVVRGIVVPRYDNEHIRAFVQGVAVDRARAGTLGTHFALNWGGHEEPDGTAVGAPKGDYNQRWITLTVEAGGTGVERVAELRKCRENVDRLIADAQTWDEVQAVAIAYQRLDERRRVLKRELRLIQEKGPPSAAWRCPGC